MTTDYEFFVGRPQLGLLQAKRLERFQLGDTVNGPNRVSAYCCPSEPFGPPPDYVGPPMSETGTETLYVTSIKQTRGSSAPPTSATCRDTQEPRSTSTS